MTFPTPKFLYNRRVLLGALLVLTIYACSSLFGPDSQQDLPKPSFAVGDVLGGTAVPRSNRNDIPIPWTSTSIVLQAETPYKIAVSGMLNFTPYPSWCPGAPARPSIPNSVGPAGFAFDVRRPWRVLVGIGTQSTEPSSQIATQPTSEAASEITGLVKGPGVIWVRRPIDPLYWSCSVMGGASRPGWIVAGTQTIKATELAPPQVVPDRNPVMPGDTVRFDLTVSWSTNFFIGSGGGWSWKSDTTTNTSSLVSCTRFQNFCRVVVRERGHVEVTNVQVEGSMWFNARSPIVEIGTSRVRIKAASGALAVKPFGTGGTSSLALEVSVEGNSGPIPDRTVDLTIEGIEGTGGHAAHAGAMPNGTLSSFTVNTGASGVVTTTYTPGVFGGNVEIRGRSTGSASALENIIVRVVGLGDLSSGGNVELIGATTAHPSNHWGTPATVGALVQLANDFYAFTGNTRKLQINDVSLNQGGKFDVAPTPINYNPDGSHVSHRVGRNVDVRTHGDSPLTEEQLDFVYDWWESRHGKKNIYIHTGANAHYHLTVPQ
jgi:hypothetical protein